MRTFKFRGKASHSGEWLFGYLINICGNYHILGKDDMREDGHHVTQDSDRPTWVDPATIGQFTGLTNRSGKAIYEGDILKMGNCDFRGVVQWHKNGYFYINEYYPKVIDDDYSPLGNMLRYDMDVIGNVFDNTKLLKGGDK